MFSENIHKDGRVCVANGNKTEIAYVIDTQNIVRKERLLGLRKSVL